jgi:hypothetical protein
MKDNEQNKDEFEMTNLISGNILSSNKMIEKYCFSYKFNFSKGEIKRTLNYQFFSIL